MTTTSLPTLMQLAITLPAFLFSISFHEFCHASAAYLLGDPTAKRMGRLTLNPLAHVDILGLAMLLLFRIGWARPVPFDAHYFTHPRLGTIITALCGPLSNFFLAVAALVGLKVIMLAGGASTLAIALQLFFEALVYINLMLGIFNLLPLPPLDGSHLLMVTVGTYYPRLVVWIYRYAFFILLFLFMLPQTRSLLTYAVLSVDAWLRSLIF
ncbi:site-2 protease family protein [bacterium]|nr:site-2 protease family protein [bacterium]